MATCPRCKGHLTDGHKCPARHRHWLVAAEITACAIGGGIASMLLLAFFDRFHQATDLDMVAALAGAIIAVGVNRILRA